MSSEQVADPVAYFLEDMTNHGRSARTVTAYERVLRDFERYLGEEYDRTPADAGYRDCVAWINTYRESHAESTVASYASYLNRFYSYMLQVGVLEENPMRLVLEEMTESINTNPTRRDISLENMRGFVASIDHPLHRAVVVTFLKTGMRAGELCNLDLRDVAISGLSHGEIRPQLAERDDSLYVSQEPTAGAIVNGERRKASNKRKRPTVVPIDAELRRELLRWLLVRPDSPSAARPLFTHTARNWGHRLTPDAAHHIVEQHARDHGWYNDGAGAEENVTPHYFRHFFTTHLRDRTGDRGVVKYLRGDVADDIIDTYTHNWGDRVRDVYERHIYTLLDSSS